MDDVKIEQDASKEAEPKGDRTFTQADYDRRVAIEVNREKEKYKDYGDLKKQVEALAAEKKERELSELSEIDKYKKQLEEVSKSFESVRLENHNYKLRLLRDDVLSDPKYNTLPRAYKSLVQPSEELDAIRASADQALEEYLADFGTKGSTPPSFGVQNVAQKITHGVQSAMTAASSEDRKKLLAEKIKSAMNPESRFKKNI